MSHSSTYIMVIDFLVLLEQAQAVLEQSSELCVQQLDPTALALYGGLRDLGLGTS